VERSNLEKLFGMSGGWVLNFSNRTFQEFVADSVSRDICCGKYDNSSGSKANLLRKFWEIEPNHVVGKVVSDLVDIAKEQSQEQDNEALMVKCQRIAERLQQGTPTEEFDAITEELAEKDFELLVKSIRASLNSNDPEAGLDRLHTFVTKFIRLLCDSRGITVTKEKPLHGLMGEYIKKIKADGLIETKMTERILNSSIANFEAFNVVRNDQSFAHDNPILNYDESLLIFNHVVSVIRFIQALERRQAASNKEHDRVEHNDIPF